MMHLHKVQKSVIRAQQLRRQYCNLTHNLITLFCVKCTFLNINLHIVETTISNVFDGTRKRRWRTTTPNFLIQALHISLIILSSVLFV